MNCPRCEGYMELETFQDYFDDLGLIVFEGWRCITCGEIIDPVIIRNRENAPPSASKKPKGEKSRRGPQKRVFPTPVLTISVQERTEEPAGPKEGKGRYEQRGRYRTRRKSPASTTKNRGEKQKKGKSKRVSQKRQ